MPWFSLSRVRAGEGGTHRVSDGRVRGGGALGVKRYPAPMSTTEITRRLRRHSTDAEKLLWRRLRSRQLGGAKFRRQHPIGPYVVDFFCSEQGLVIELDGGQYAIQAERDARRDRWMESQGYRVLRFWNHELMANVDGVLRRILRTVGGDDEASS